MAPRIYIDGHVGTTGLRIHEGLAARDDLDLVTLAEAERKDPGARREAIASADLAVLCLPDDAAREAAAWAAESGTRVIDASTAHRVHHDWVYGLAELAPGQRDAIAAAERVANPGCYPTAVILLLRPLVEAGLVAPDAPLTIHALSGYSGGGRSMIERWEEPGGALAGLPFEAPYALGRVHKHIPEMRHYASLASEPVFVPAVGPFRSGMRVEIPLPVGLLAPGCDAKAVVERLSERYANEPFVRVAQGVDPEAIGELGLDPRACNGSNRVELYGIPHPSGHVLLVALLDNLGKGASGAAIQGLNLMLGLPEARGLDAR